jgi:hypothetical protein
MFIRRQVSAIMRLYAVDGVWHHNYNHQLANAAPGLEQPSVPQTLSKEPKLQESGALVRSADELVMRFVP